MRGWLWQGLGLPVLALLACSGTVSKQTSQGGAPGAPASAGGAGRGTEAGSPASGAAGSVGGFGAAGGVGGAPANGASGRASQGGAPAGAAAGTVGGTGEVCGTSVCSTDQTCCNASCGLCAPRGGACIQIACEPSSGGSPGMIPGACKTSSDCRLFDDYCTGCDCRALGKADRDPSCSGPGVRCLVAPCQGQRAVCVDGRCKVSP